MDIFQALSRPIVELSNRLALSPFEEQLIYGIDVVRVDTHSYQTHECTLYSHEKYPTMMVAIQQQQYRVLDIPRCRIAKLVPHLQVKMRIKCYLQIKDGVHELLLLFPNLQTRNRMHSGLQALVEKYRLYSSEVDSNIMRIFLEADTSHNGLLSLGEVRSLLRELRIVPNSQIDGLLKECKRNLLTGEGEMNLKEFELFAKLMICKLELLKLFQGCIDQKLDSLRKLTHAVMDKLQFGEFLIAHQHTPAKEAQDIVDTVFSNKAEKISFYNFCAHLLSKQNSIVDLRLQEEQFSEDHPLHHYYCYSSHNTYLSGNQLTSNSKVQRYVEDLEDGVRCVQLDIHDDGDVPIIKHGYTATQPILFEDVIYSIARFCEVDPNHTPIILSLENHCCRQNKQRVAQILVKHFCPKQLLDGKLLIAKGETYPTLKQLRGKIIIKGSGDHQELSNLSVRPGQFTEESEDEDQVPIQFEGQQPRRLPVPFARKKAAFMNSVLSLKKQKQGSCQKFERATMVINGFRVKNSNMNSPQLLSITSMLSSGKLGRVKCWESVSLSESKALSLTKDRNKLHEHTSGSWIRIYPDGSRITSSNYNPLPMFELGAQLVALNTQYKGVQTNILRSFFTGHPNQQGYLLKPLFLRTAPLPKPDSPTKPINIKIKVLSCHSLLTDEPSDDIPDVTVNIGLFGSQQEKPNNLNMSLLFPFTETVRGNCYNPVFRQAREFTCSIVHPYFAMVYFEVPDCGRAAIPVRFLRAGYRSVRLLDSIGHENGSLILVHVEIN